MIANEVSKRYARALFELAQESKKTDIVFSELRMLAQAISADSELADFLSSPIVAPDQKEKALKLALQGKISQELMGTLQVMATKNRLGNFRDMLAAFEEINDESTGVTRGLVRSVGPMSDSDKKKIEDTISGVIKKKVILSYEQDPTLLGGLVAQVAGWSFDDSLKTHLNKLNDELNRRAN